MVNSVIILISQMAFPNNFPTQIPECDCHSAAYLYFFLSCDASICSTMTFPPVGNSDHVVISVSLTFCQTQNGMPYFIE